VTGKIEKLNTIECAFDKMKIKELATYDREQFILIDENKELKIQITWSLFNRENEFGTIIHIVNVFLFKILNEILNTCKI